MARLWTRRLSRSLSKTQRERGKTWAQGSVQHTLSLSLISVFVSCCSPSLYCFHHHIQTLYLYLLPFILHIQTLCLYLLHFILHILTLFLYLLPFILHTHSPSNSLFLSSDPLIFPSPTPCLCQDRIEDSSSAENGHLAAEKTHSFPTTGGLSHSLSNSGLTPAVLVAQVTTLTLSLHSH